MGKAVVRVCLGASSALLLVLGSVVLASGLNSRAKCKAAEIAIPLSTFIDVGSSASHRATLHQSAAFVCRQTISMATDLRAGENAADLLHGLEMTVIVTDPHNVEVLRGVFPDPLKPMGNGQYATLVNSTPLPIGEYSLVIDVSKPAPALAGLPVRVLSRYHLCGLEWTAPAIGIGVGVLALTLGVLLSLFTWKLHRRAILASK